VTLVGHTLDQTARLAELVERELDIDHGRSVTFAEANAGGHDAGSLKYPYAQYRARLDDSRSGLPEWMRFAGLTVQVDVQTRLQQTWEKIDSTSLAFHWPTSYAAGVHERIARAVEHIVEADRELAAAESEAWALARRYSESISSGDLELNLNGSSLAAYLRISEVVSELVRIGEEAGLQHDDEPDEPGDWAVEQRHLWLLSRMGLTTVPELDNILRASLGRAPEILGELSRVTSERDFQPFATRESIVAWMLLVLHRAEGWEVNLTSFAEEIEYALNMLIGNPIPPPAEQD
jgi:GTP pyrophosphokinase